MAESGQSFAEFERAGWEDPSVVAGYDEHLSVVTTQSIPVLLDAAGVHRGSRVLDVATGAGYVAGAAFQRGADAVGIDFSVGLVNLARNRYPAMRFERADAEALPFESSEFDAVVSAFGICHLPNPDLALGEAYRVLKSGGRVAFSVWDLPERAIGVGAVYNAVRAHGSMDVGLPAGPNFFLFSDPEYSIKALRDAGFDSPTVRQAPQVWRIDDPDSLFDKIACSSVRAGTTLRAENPAAQQNRRAWSPALWPSSDVGASAALSRLLLLYPSRAPLEITPRDIVIIIHNRRKGPCPPAYESTLADAISDLLGEGRHHIELTKG